ncbi:MAG: protoporphyrinogen oxidase [Nitrospira sp.]|nr:protoporphyrinogen oxidase [Nitrospira sp.]
MNQSRTVVIVGGGISGLATAFALHEQAAASGLSIRCTVLESGSTWGGKIVTHRVGDLVTEAGPDSFLSQKPAGLALCQKLGLSDQLIDTNITGKKAFVLRGGRLHELPEGLVSFVPKELGPFLRSGLLSWTGLARMGLDVLVPRGSSVCDESLAFFFRRRFGAQAFERVLEPLMAGIYAGDAEQMSVKATAQQGTELRLGGRVDAMRVRSHQPGRWMYDLILQDGSALSAESLVLATPAYVSAELLRPLTPIAGGLLETIPYASTATIAMAYPANQVAGAVEGFGFIVPRKEGRDLIAATWTSLKWPYRAPSDRVLVRCYVGGVGREAILQSEDDELIARVRTELAALCGITAEPSYTEVNRWWKAMPQYTLGHLSRLVQIDAALSRYPGLVLTGAGYRGVGIPDCIRDGAVAAGKVMGYLTGQPAH